jgi:hypothetical protein
MALALRLGHNGIIINNSVIIIIITPTSLAAMMPALELRWLLSQLLISLFNWFDYSMTWPTAAAYLASQSGC